MNYTITFFKLIMEDTKAIIMYWELEYDGGKKLRFSNIDAAKKWANDNIK